MPMTGVKQVQLAINFWLFSVDNGSCYGSFPDLLIAHDTPGSDFQPDFKCLLYM